MSTPAAVLCQTLIEDTFGDLAAVHKSNSIWGWVAKNDAQQLFEALTVHGRLSLHGLVNHSGLTPRQVRHAIAILVQQNLVVWSPENNDNVSYEAHVRNAYNLVRQGKFLRVVEERYGNIGEIVASTVVQSGHGRISDIVSSVVEKVKKEEQNSDAANRNSVPQVKTNGTLKKETEADKQLANEIRVTALAMIDAGFITVSHDSHYRPVADNYTLSRDKQSRMHGEKVKKADEAMFRRGIRERMVDWQYNISTRNDVLSRTSSLDIKVGQKRAALSDDTGDEISSKRLRLSGKGASAHKVNVSWNLLQETKIKPLDDLIVKVNYDKLSVVIRNEKLTALVDLRIGQATSLIYEELLSRLSQPLLYCKALVDARAQAGEEEGKEIYPDDDENLTELTRDIAASVDLSNVDAGFGSPPSHRAKKSAKTNGLGPGEGLDEQGDKRSAVKDNDPADDEEPPRRKLPKKSKKPPLKNEHSNGYDTDEDLDDDFEADDADSSVVKQHLLLLKNYEPQLARYHQPTHLKSERWSIDFASVSHHLRLNMIDDIIRARFGQPALRLVRIMREKGKLEQKHLSGFSLLNHKTQLALLTALHTGGYVELQEVPKDSTRAPGKTLFLWFFDERRCTMKMLEDSHKAMTRLLQRRRLESEKFRNVIEKTQRSDFEGNEDEMLTSHEKVQLEKWYGIEEKLMTEVGRLDDVVYCLRDF